MLLQSAVQSVFIQLSESLDQLSPEQYARPSVRLFGASIGQHVRHIIELFQCLEKGYEVGMINYENRPRDKMIETDKGFAKTLIPEIYLNLNKRNKGLLLEVSSYEASGELLTLETNYHREVAYNLEHAVHHMALIKVGLHEVSDVVLPKAYGVAFSTLKFRNTCVQ